MDGEANLPAPPAASRNLARTITTDSYPSRSVTSSAASSSSSASSPPDFLRHVQAAFKRHRPLVTMQSNNIRPRRILVPPCKESRCSNSNVGPPLDAKRSQVVVPFSQGLTEKSSTANAKNTISVAGETKEDALIMRPSFSGATTSTYEESQDGLDVPLDQSKPFKNSTEIPLSRVESQDSQHIPAADDQKKVQLSMASNTSTQEMELDVSNLVDGSTVINQDLKQQNFQNTESEVSIKSEGGLTSLLAKRTTHAQDQLQQFRNFLQSDSNHPMTQSSIVGSSCATTTLINSTSAPMISSTTYCSRSTQDLGSHVAVELCGDLNVNPQPIAQRDLLQPSYPSSKCTTGMPIEQTANAAQVSTSVIDSQKEYCLLEEQQGCRLKENNIPRGPSPVEDKSTKEKGFAGDVTDIQSQAPLSKNSCSDVKLEHSKSEKQEKVVSGKGTSAPRKRNYDPDLFFKVNGKLYQRLGKIGSGGSSEVHKVISSDCIIYALKKIKLKGRDYATAYGFCQEIEYLNKLKGKSNIIQLIDFEVTDKRLLQEVASNKDGRVKDDGYLYMVLEYGEIDLAHMLSQKWKEMGGSDQTIDENWLRFYWQQILLAVNTIHEERIVHSDLKPANFLLVKGSLKLIDFGIAKAILSDTTNIQRDSQVGTLSYMSPEAFLCNENDANGNTIKCGRPSDIWSLGCILYQMVYGRTPFSEYKTFWAKFKVITDRNHEITYGPLSNPWLLDLMKKCLAWDRNERWRIPQLLQHPFLVPPVPPQLPPQCQNFELFQLIAEACVNDQEASMLYSRLQKLLTDPLSIISVESLTSPDQCCKLLLQMSKFCIELQQRLATSSGNIE
ncbi:serine/threonine-protein kinase MPS1 isoform X2 [Malania oleifera]|uniref:serine/threonine-protein kinase MPS1 isoform X2 n=1 Tax=Malania oleifera TaxID=397392 RepID=UPI0025ADEC81|nr:serine/threonine-protein kinase MPS1 isoform X2 [Malania oleifera]